MEIPPRVGDSRSARAEFLLDVYRRIVAVMLDRNGGQIEITRDEFESASGRFMSEIDEKKLTVTRTDRHVA